MFRYVLILAMSLSVYIQTAAVHAEYSGGAQGSLMQDTGLHIIHATGRAVVMDEDTVEEARALALEDALYYAALQGGAKVEGYSAVDSLSHLSEQIVVRPSSDILDYRIISEVQDETHYEIVVEAVIGNIETTGCQNRPLSHITLFKPRFKLEPDVPNWMSQAPAYLSRKLAVSLSNKHQLRVRDARHTEVDEIQFGDRNLYDYRTLTSGRIELEQGDMGLITSVHLDIDSTRNMLSKTNFVEVLISTEFISSSGNNAGEPIEDKFRIRLSEDHILRTVSVLGAEKREVIARLLAEAADIHAAKLTEHLLCMPLRDRLIVNDKTLMVNVGTLQGLKHNHLAVAKGLDNPMTFLRVTSAQHRKAELMPLDSNIDLAQLDGIEVTFLEFNQ
jgi:hypothetical protein